MKKMVVALLLMHYFTIAAITDHRAPGYKIADYYFVPLPAYVSASEIIVEGKIISEQEPYFIKGNVAELPSYGNYYTDYTLQVKKYYKDTSNRYTRNIDVTQEGSRKNLIVKGFPPLQVGQNGIFFLIREDDLSQIPGKLSISPYGFYKIYDGEIFQVYGENKDIPEMPDFRSKLSYLSLTVESRLARDVFDEIFSSYVKEDDNQIQNKVSDEEATLILKRAQEFYLKLIRGNIKTHQY